MGKGEISFCIIPAAGKGSRWAPVSGYLPKEMLPLIDLPVIEWVVEEAINSGCKEIIVVINKQKEAIKKYLLTHKEFHKKIKFHFVYQEKPLGITHAIQLCQKIIKDQPFAMALPDLPTISHKPVLKQLIEAFEENQGYSHIISFSSFPSDTLSFYTECLIEQRKDKLLSIIHFCPKQTDSIPHHPGSKIRMSGRYVLKPEIFKIADDLMRSFEGTELNEVVTLKKAIEGNQQVIGLNIDGHTYDTGNPTLYVRANTAFFKKKLAKRK